MPTPPPWWNETHVPPLAVLRSALRSGQSDTASEPSRIASVSRLGLATEPGVEVVAADHDGRLELALRHHLVEREAQPVAILHAHPADARRQALEGDAAARHVEPVVQVRVVRQQLLHLRVGAVDVLGIARERHPAERALALAEERPDVGRHEAREVEGVRHAPCPSPSGGCCCRSRRRRAARLQRRASRAPAIAIERFAALDDRPAGRRAARSRHSSTRPAAAAGSRCTGSWAEVWSVTHVRRTPRRTSSGKTSAALPSSPTETGRPSRFEASMSASASSRVVGLAVEVAGLQRACRCATRRTRPRSSRSPPWSPRAAARRPCRRGPAVRIQRPAGSPPKCWSAIEKNVS